MMGNDVSFLVVALAPKRKRAYDLRTLERARKVLESSSSGSLRTPKPGSGKTPWIASLRSKISASVGVRLKV